MKKNWLDLLEIVNEKITILEENGSDIIYFRGHSDSTWELLPSILRKDISENFNVKDLESCLYYDFISNAGPLLKNKNQSWDILYLMRHHGIPTRLIDWSENFATALFFAISNPILNNPEIWILDPHKLNKKESSIGEVLINPEIDMEFSYYQVFIEEKKEAFKLPIAIYPSRNNKRLSAQKGLFTIHGTKAEPLEKTASDCLYRIPIPTDLLQDARVFLKLAGINEFSIFQDLDSLSRHLKNHHKY